MKSELNDLAAFAIVATERSFTRAAARLGVTQSALSHTIRGLERRLELQLLARTTKSVTPTSAGAALLMSLSPALEQIDRALNEVRIARDRPAGRLRIAVSKSAAVLVLLPKLPAFAAAYPEVVLDVSTSTGVVDLVGGGFDAGIQLEEFIQKDMIAMRVTQELRLAAVASPGYFATRSPPLNPRDLSAHNCIGLRLPGGPYRWEFEKDGACVATTVTGSLVVDDTSLAINGALAGLGIALAYEEQVSGYIEQGKLIRVLEDWSPSFPGFFIYYPDRRHQSAALSALIRTLRLP
ncbi:LysR family transcriptional regulator [Lysobacter capsici]|uniref:LysR substrate-binding domain-containing protein n=1 Tax=Lysobacter capsici TaxID=435897 RepID=UPI000BBA5CD6|nr:LysR family transcriptional regulator [Lysobacter capsici]ATE74139.1 LysR family transcriptional regulator [Lysobacter capsici]